MAFVRAVVVAWVALGVACIQPELSVCDALACPTGKQCVVAGTVALCATVDQLASCANASDGTPCPSGACFDRVCQAIVCGNGRVEPGEQCDDRNTDAGDGCSPVCQLEGCGNGITDVGEACDCGDPTVTPRPECGGHHNSDSDTQAPCRGDCTLRRCGDGVLEAPEQCEGSDLGGLTCGNFGYYGGQPSCTAFCTIDTTGCTGHCGDNVLESPEEQCDGDVGATTCADFGYYTGTLGCSPFCAYDTGLCMGRCGDGVLQGTHEQCDGGPGAATCMDLGYYGGTLGCTGFCTYDTTGCIGRCGDGMVHAPQEACDGLDLGSATCQSLGYYSAVNNLTCTPSCTFDASNCGGHCGDGVINGTEQCDVAPDGTKNFGTKTCATFGMTGSLTCGGTCTIDVRSCQGCGNSTCEPGLGETCYNCPGDCGDCCGNGACDLNLGEDCTSCPGDCMRANCCIDGLCDLGGGESCGACPEDCVRGTHCCGDGTCSPGEGCTCPDECGFLC
jgi:cysteine-rich repeat protein